MQKKLGIVSTYRTLPSYSSQHLRIQSYSHLHLFSFTGFENLTKWFMTKYSNAHIKRFRSNSANLCSVEEASWEVGKVIQHFCFFYTFSSFNGWPYQLFKSKYMTLYVYMCCYAAIKYYLIINIHKN